jgi:hypothetical protein
MMRALYGIIIINELEFNERVSVALKAAKEALTPRVSFI